MIQFMPANHSNQGSTLIFETGGPPGPPEANSTRPNSNLGGPVYNFIKSCINSYSTLGTINYSTFHAPGNEFAGM